MKRWLLLIIVLLVAVFVTPAYSSTYQLYHIAVRDFNGDGNFNGGDHVRIGFAGDPVVDYAVDVVLTNGHELYYDKFVGVTQSSYDYGDRAYQTETYAGVKVRYDGDYDNRYGTSLAGTAVNPNLVSNVTIYPDESMTPLGSYNVSLPSDISQYAYNGPDMNTLQTSKVAGGVEFRWDAVSNPNSNAQYRFTMYNQGGPGENDYDIMRSFDASTTSLVIPDELFEIAEADRGTSMVWALGFQERFYVDGHDFGELVRSYCPTEGEFNTAPVPLPAGVWLLGSGLIGLIGVRRRFAN